MNKLIMRNVGDGLSIINGNWMDSITIDLGGDKEFIKYYHAVGPAFLLSHFHSDHHNGISYNLELNLNNWYIDDFYYPIMPEIVDKVEFSRCLFAMNIRINPYYPTQNNIFGMIDKLNGHKKFKKHPLQKGDKFPFDGKTYEVLYPPPQLLDNKTVGVLVRRAIKTFNEAKQCDSLLEEIYSRLEADTERDFFNYEYKSQVFNLEEQPIDRRVSAANKALKDAANSLSLAFKQEDNLLFFGDLNRQEIKIIVDELIHDRHTHFEIIIAPHHGTKSHWEDSIKNLNAEVCLASAGKQRRKDLDPQYSEIAKKFINTHDWGDIIINRSIKVKSAINFL